MIKIVKIGGNVVDNPTLLRRFIKDFAAMPGMKILVHGGGVMANQMQKSLGMEPLMIEGRRVTDEETLRIVTMVYAGWCNKHITALLQAEGCNAIGLTGADGNAIKASKRAPVKVDLSEEAAQDLQEKKLVTRSADEGHFLVDYGYVGDVTADSVNSEFITTLLERGIVPVFNAINHDGMGNLLNTNADTIASSVAIAVANSSKEMCELIYCFEKNGVLFDKNDDNSVIPGIDKNYFTKLRAEGRVADGMIPKLTNAFNAINKGVARVIVKHAQNLLNETGTTLSK